MADGLLARLYGGVLFYVSVSSILILLKNSIFCEDKKSMAV